MKSFELYKTIIFGFATVYIINILNTSFFTSVAIAIVLGITFHSLCSLYEHYTKIAP